MKKGKLFVIILLAGSFVLGGCNYNHKITPKQSLSLDSLVAKNKNLTLEDFVVKSGNIITKKIYPPIIHADEIAYNLSDYLLIDIRPKKQYEEGHIDGAWNVDRKDLLNFLRTQVNPAFYKKIIIIDTYGPVSTYIASVLRFYGYDNAFGLKFGMAAWNKDFAKYIKPYLSNKYADRLDTVSVAIPDTAFSFPLLPELPIEKLLETQVQQAISLRDTELIASVEQAFGKDSMQYVVAYWTEGKYRIGHIPGSVRYQPRVDLTVDKYLNTLPTYKNIVVYCNTGHHAAAISAYLRLLGYHAKFILYGANSFMNAYLSKFFPGAAVTDVNVVARDFPYIKGDKRTEKKVVAGSVKVTGASTPVKPIKPIVKRKKKQEGGGGCE